MNMRYIRHKSLTWWAGLASIAIGTAAAFLPDNATLPIFGDVFAALIGSADGSPATLILSGIAVIGIRDKMERSG